MLGQTRTGWMALCFVALLCGGCTASLNELDACGDLAGAVCERLADCHSYDEQRACERELSKHCVKVDSVDSDDPAECASDLRDSCRDGLPESCSALPKDLGCNQCTTSSPDSHLVDACCSVDPFSAVCGGC